MKTVETSTSMKQIYRHHFLNYIINDDVDSIESLYTISRHLMNYKDINSLKEDFGDKYPLIMKKFNAFLPNYQLAKQFRKIMSELKSHKDKEEYEDKLRKLCTILPVINDAVILVFTSLVRNTDLKNLPIPHPNIKDIRDDSMPLSFNEESY